MGIVSQERFVELVDKPVNPVGYNYDREYAIHRGLYNALAYSGYGRYLPDFRRVQVNRESALNLYAQLRSHVMRNGCIGNKAMRPWDIDPELYAGLDRSKPWWGFEFETGYQTEAGRAEVIAHVWDTFDNVCFDSEGEGNYHSEITFSPQEMDKFEDGTAQAYQFMDYLSRQDHLTMNTGYSSVGTHINLSVPGLNANNYTKIADCLNATLNAIPILRGNENNRYTMFGRARMYDGFFGQCSEAGDAYWLEGKLFRTAYNFDQFQTYIKVCKAITKVVEKLVAEDTVRSATGRRVLHCTNLYEVAFEGAEIALDWTTFDIYMHDSSDLANGCRAPDANRNYDDYNEDDYSDDEDY